MLLKGAQEKGFRILNSDRSLTSYKTPLSVSCAGALPGGGFILGYSGGGAAAVITPPFDAIDTKMAQLTYDCLAAVVAYAFVGALVFGALWNAVARRLLKRVALDPQGGDCDDSRTPGITELNHVSSAARFLTLLWFLLTIGGLGGAWWVYPDLANPVTPIAWLYYGSCCLVSGTALVCLGAQFGLTPRLRPLTNVSSAKKGQNEVSWFLILVSIALAAACNYLNIRNYLTLQHEMPKVIVACWIAAQVLIVMAVSRGTRSRYR